MKASAKSATNIKCIISEHLRQSISNLHRIFNEAKNSFQIMNIKRLFKHQMSYFRQLQTKYWHEKVNVEVEVDKVMTSIDKVCMLYSMKPKIDFK